MSPRKLSNNLSVYLDGLRLFAAFLVFLTHAHNFLIPKLTTLVSYGREAVAVFFVLSGFVIAFVRSEKEHDLKAYAVARLSRIYPVALLAIFVTIAADAVGLHFARDQYAAFNDQYHFFKEFDPGALLAYLTFTNQIWFTHAVLGTNEPYWSLGFEVWYYILFGIFAFLSGRLRLLALALAMLICGPKVLLYLPVWALGCAAYHFVSQKQLGRGLAAVLFVLSVVGLAATVIFTSLIQKRFHIGPTTMYDSFPLWQEAVNAAYFYILGLLVTVNIVAFNFMVAGWNLWGPRLTRFIRWAAGASFTLYIVHQPIEVLIASLAPFIRTNLAYGVIAMAVTLGLVLVLAELGERRKRIVSQFLLAVWPRR